MSRRRKKESHNEEFKRHFSKYCERLRGNAYLRSEVWIIFEDSEEDRVGMMGFEPAGMDVTLLLAFSSKAKAVAHLKREVHLEREVRERKNFRVDGICLATLVILAMTGTVRNIAIDKTGDDSAYEMLNVVKMKAAFDKGLRLDE